MIKKGSLHFSFTNAFNFLMLFYTLLVCRNLYLETFREMFNPAPYSEFLVNYQSGFVRRGLFGEILYQVCTNFSLNPIHIIDVISITCFICVVAFFVYQFLKNKLNWWILPLGFFLATGWIIRKDYFMILMLIVIVYSYFKIERPIFKMIFLTLLEIILIFSHEAFFFFGTPFVILLFLRDKNLNLKFSVRFLFSGILIVSFLLVCYYKGDEEISLNILKSWSSLLPKSMMEYTGTLESLRWKSIETFIYHFRLNFFERSCGIIGLFVRPIALLLIYYLAVHVLFVFRKSEAQLYVNDKSLLSAILFFQFIMLVPMFTILSCDCGRVVLYWLASSFVFFLLVPRKILENVFPKWYIEFVNKVNKKMELVIFPSQACIVLLILFLAITPSSFHLDTAFNRTVFSVVFSTLSDVVYTFALQF